LCCGSNGALTNGHYIDKEAAYYVGPLSTRWERIEVDDQNDLAWYNSALDAIIQVNASCDQSLDVPLKALTNQLLIGFTERQYKEQHLVPMSNREALKTHLLAKLDGVPNELVLTVLKKNGCVYDFSVMAPSDGRFAAARDDYESFLRGFRSGS